MTSDIDLVLSHVDHGVCTLTLNNPGRRNAWSPDMEQAYFGNPGDNGFHNAEWGRMMKRVGLHPSSTGKPSGQQTGTRTSHYVIPGGAFARTAAEHPILKKERLAFYE